MSQPIGLGTRGFWVSPTGLGVTGVTKDQLLERFPEFVDVPDAILDYYINLADKLLCADEWGNFYNDATGLVAAHYIAIMNQVSNGGEKGGVNSSHGSLISASAAGMSASFGQFKVNDKSLHQQFFSKTAYGQLFLSLQSTTVSIAVLAL